jgi:hypothetical protein
MNWPVVGWPTQTEFQLPVYPDRSPRSDNVQAAIGRPQEPQVNTGIRWRSIRSPANNNWRSVCYAPELRLFCAVATSGTRNRVMTSPDGLLWTLQSDYSIEDGWISVCWSPKLRLFCAVGTVGSVMVSSDGKSWTGISAILSTSTSVCWSNKLGLFCAVSSSGSGQDVGTSPDGITWTIRNDASNGYGFNSVCWSEELSIFCAIAVSGVPNRCNTSPDGITWTAVTLPTATTYQSVVWSKKLGLFVAGGNTGIIVASPNGTTWTQLLLKLGGGLVNANSISVSEELGLLVVVGAGTMFGSWKGVGGLDDVIAPSIPATNIWRSVCYSEDLNRFVAVSNSGTGNRIATSP